MYIVLLMTCNEHFQVCGDGKALLDSLQTPVCSSSANSITAKADYSESAGHVLDVVHEASIDWLLCDSISCFSLCG